MPALAQLRSFARTRRGQLAIGGTVAAGAATAGLLRRHRSGGDPTPPDGTSLAAGAPYTMATGTSGSNLDAFPSLGDSGVSITAFEELVSAVGHQSDQLQRLIDQKQATAAPNPAPTKTAPRPAPPAPKPVAKPATRTYTVVRGDTLSAIARRFGVSGGWQALYQANRGVVGGNPNLIKPGQRLNIPA